MKINVARHAKSNLSRSPRKSFQVIFLSSLSRSYVFFFVSSSLPRSHLSYLFSSFSQPPLSPPFFFFFFFMLPRAILRYFKLYRWFRGDRQQPNSQHESMRTRHYTIGSGHRTYYNLIARCGDKKLSIETPFFFLSLFKKQSFWVSESKSLFR